MTIVGKGIPLMGLLWPIPGFSKNNSSMYTNTTGRKVHSGISSKVTYTMLSWDARWRLHGIHVCAAAKFQTLPNDCLKIALEKEHHSNDLHAARYFRWFEINIMQSYTWAYTSPQRNTGARIFDIAILNCTGNRASAERRSVRHYYFISKNDVVSIPPCASVYVYVDGLFCCCIHFLRTRSLFTRCVSKGPHRQLNHRPSVSLTRRWQCFTA